MRADLMRLSPEALAQLANVGLLKRAQRELESGYLPALQLASDGTLTASFPDAVVTEFPPAAGLKEAKCSCGAPVCRHRIAAILHYRAEQSQAASSESPTSAIAAQPAFPSFAELSDATLHSELASGVWKQVQNALLRPMRIDVEISAAAAPIHSPIFSARLPHASARFYAGADLAVARCDCRAQQYCEHIALGAMAIRSALLAGLKQGSARIEMGAQRALSIAAVQALDVITQLQRALLDEGLAYGAAESCAVLLNRAHAAAKTLGATWLVLALAALEAWMASYISRSAAFSYGDGLALLRELSLRVRIAQLSGKSLAAASDATASTDASAAVAVAPSASAVLGLNEPMESALDRLSLISLGMRVHSDGVERQATLVVVDVDTQTLMVLQKGWQRPANHAQSERAVLESQRVSTLRLSSLAQGSLITSTAKRRANGELKLGQSFAGKAAINLHNGDWSMLKAPLLIQAQSDYLAQRTRSLPPELAPRLVLQHFHVLEVTAIHSIFYDAASQTLCASAVDASGASWRLAREYNAGAPGALDSLSALYASATVRFVAGRVRLEQGECILEPWAVSQRAISQQDAATYQLSVPDLMPKTGALAHVLLGSFGEAQDVLSHALLEIDECVMDLLRDGLKRFSGATRLRFAATARRCRAVGLLQAADLMTHLAEALTVADPDTDTDPGTGTGTGAAPDQADSVDLAIRNLLIWTTLAQHARVESSLCS